MGTLRVVIGERDGGTEEERERSLGRQRGRDGQTDRGMKGGKE